MNEFFGHVCICSSTTAFDKRDGENVIRFCCDCERSYVIDKDGKVLNQIKELGPDEIKEYLLYEKVKGEHTGYYGILHRKTNRIAIVHTHFGIVNGYLKKFPKDDNIFKSWSKIEFINEEWEKVKE